MFVRKTVKNIDSGFLVSRPKEGTNFFMEWASVPERIAEIHRITCGRPGQQTITYTYQSPEFYDGEIFLFIADEKGLYYSVCIKVTNPNREVKFNKYGDLLSINGVAPRRGFITGKTVFDKKLFYSLLLDERRLIRDFLVRVNFEKEIIDG